MTRIEPTNVIMDTKERYKIHNILLYLVLAAVCILVTNLATDVIAQANGAIDRGTITFRNLFGDMVVVGTKAFHFSPKTVSAISIVILELTFVAISQYYFLKSVKTSSDYVKFLSLACIVFAAGPYNPVSGHIYSGVGGINTWHNATSFAVKPFLVLSFFLFQKILDLSDKDKPDRIIDKKGYKCDAFILSGILLAVSLYVMTCGKISGLTLIAPAAFVYLVYRWIRSKFSMVTFRRFLFIGCMFIPALCVFVVKLFHFFPLNADVGESQIVFVGLSRILSSEFPSILYKSCWPLMFPIYMFIVRYKSQIKNRGVGICWLMYASAFIQRFMFMEVGPRAGHGNSSWGSHYAVLILIIVSLIELANYAVEIQCTKDIKVLFKEKRYKEILFSKDVILCLIGYIFLIYYLISGIIFVMKYLYIGSYGGI
ncbi:MAG: hypothetical protein LBN34_06030 [Clostridiales Family XIII bacterium]|jgi:hypothetical protein|nr:hypothetical protein [Clostridiales Family XIII bacterium]